MKHRIVTTFLITVCFFSLSFAQKAPDFTITTTSNETVSLYEDYLDQGKAVVLKIMFTTCPPCNSIAPHMQPLYESWGAGTGDVEFFDLSNKSWDSNADVLAYANNHGLTFPGAGEDGGSLAVVQPYQSGIWGPFTGTPTFVVISPDGTVKFNVDGNGNSNTIDSIDAAITRALIPNNNSEDTTVIQGTIMSGPPQDVKPLSGVTFMLDVPAPGTDLPLSGETGADGTFYFEFAEPLPNGSRIIPMLDAEPKPGVSTWDLFQIMIRLANVEPWDNSFQFRQGDANGDNATNVLDVVEIRKLILGITHEFPSNESNLLFGTVNPIDDGMGGELEYAPYILTVEGQTEYNVDFYVIKRADMDGSYGF